MKLELERILNCGTELWVAVKAYDGDDDVLIRQWDGEPIWAEIGLSQLRNYTTVDLETAREENLDTYRVLRGRVNPAYTIIQRNNRTAWFYDNGDSGIWVKGIGVMKLVDSQAEAFRWLLMGKL